METAFRRTHRRLLEMILFALLGTLMFVSKIAMEGLPNVHSLGLLLAVYTLVFRWKAVIPLYVYVFLNGLYAGFNVWWIPYLYLWAILWLWLLLIPPRWKAPVKAAVAWGMIVLHGLLFGVLYAPFWALYARLNWAGTLAWIASGFPFDCLHALGNAGMGLLIYPLFLCLNRLKNRYFSSV